MKDLIPKNNTRPPLNSDAFENRLKEMRGEFKLEERCTLDMVCSETGLPFTLTLMRESATERFQIEKAERVRTKAEGKPETFLGRVFSAPPAERTKFDAREMSFTGFACPWCHHKASPGIAPFVDCGCGTLQCGSRIALKYGAASFTCHDGCGKTGQLGGRIEKFDASAGGKAPARPALSGPAAAPRLPGQTKRLGSR